MTIIFRRVPRHDELFSVQARRDVIGLTTIAWTGATRHVATRCWTHRNAAACEATRQHALCDAGRKHSTWTQRDSMPNITAYAATSSVSAVSASIVLLWRRRRRITPAIAASGTLVWRRRLFLDRWRVFLDCLDRCDTAIVSTAIVSTIGLILGGRLIGILIERISIRAADRIELIHRARHVRPTVSVSAARILRHRTATE